jgi:mono/diheme cytochrome c family protein
MSGIVSLSLFARRSVLRSGGSGRRWLTRGPVAIAAAWLAGQTAAAAEGGTYSQDIRPLLRERCVSCHGALKQKGGLRLDAGALILKGSEHPVVTPGDSARSPLLERVLSTDKEERMPPEGRPLTPAEIERLRAWIDAGASYPDDEVVPTAPADHWSFQPVRRPAIPAVKDRTRVRNEIDAFVLAKLEAQGTGTLPPAAPPAVLRRRLHLDLTGLPPTVAGQQQLTGGFTMEQLVDDLLSRPEYGERWARHWLDVVRYADTNGYERDAEKPFVWRYRDYVIESLNRDTPFNRFVLEQLAGDELPDRSIETHIATGFLRLGHWDDEPADSATDRFDQLDDIVSTTAQALLGLTVGCARCHDHKFEPLSTRDYYGLVAVFNPLERPRDGRTEQTLLVNGTEVYALREAASAAPETHVLIRGAPGNLGDRVDPAVPAILVREQPAFPGPSAATTGRRLGLAEWIASDRNPLTARVIVNRVWQQHFGQGLVTTANDFGLMGAAPSHPELLDWLAHWFMHDAGWSLKKLHRLILTSSAWQTVRTPDSLLRYRRLEVEALRDSMLAVSGQLNPRRFGPAMRPSIPAAAIEANTDKDSVWKASDEPEASRRSLYAFIKRGLVVPLFESLDLADTVSSCPQRQVTTVAPQALSLFNGEFVNRQAAHFATRLRREAGDNPAARVTLAWRLALSREPSAPELEKMLTFLREESLEQLCRVVLNLNEFAYPE